MTYLNPAVLVAAIVIFSGCAVPKQNQVAFTVTSEPAGARIYLDGGYRGQTPVSVKWSCSRGATECSTRLYSAVLDGYVPVQKRFSLNPYHGVSQSYRFVLRPDQVPALRNQQQQQQQLIVVSQSGGTQ